MELILGLSEFEKAMSYFNEKKYAECEVYLKEALKILKRAEQDKSMGYLFIFKRLAYVCFMNRKYSDAEKYFSIAADVMREATNNPANIFIAKKNLLLCYTYTNI